MSKTFTDQVLKEVTNLLAQTERIPFNIKIYRIRPIEFSSDLAPFTIPHLVLLSDDLDSLTSLGRLLPESRICLNNYDVLNST